MPSDAEARIRDATAADAARVREIYRPHVSDGAVTFETEVPSVTEFARRIADYSAYAFLVTEVGDEVVAYAYASRHRERQAYRWCCEVSIYVDPSHQRRGLARILYTELFRRLKEKNLVHAYAGITLPNAASVRLHEALGFRPLGVYKNIGYKSGAWHDVGWWELTLSDVKSPPPEPRLQAPELPSNS